MRAEAKGGIANETMIRVVLDNHRYKELSEKWKRHMKRMFPEIGDNDLIKTMTYPHRDAKPDLIIIVNSRKVYLSIKSGHSPVVHHEPIYTFFDFLKQYEVPDRILNLLRFYHYGAAYMIGENSNKIYTREEIVSKYPQVIKEINDYFASREELISQIVYRTVIKGRLDRDLIDYFYYGNAARGYLLSVSEILKLITRSKCILNQTVSFRHLTYVSGSRHVGEPLQKQVKIHWPVLCKWFFDTAFMMRFG